MLIGCHSLCNLCVLCVSVVILAEEQSTTETQSTQRLHREDEQLSLLRGAAEDQSIKVRVVAQWVQVVVMLCTYTEVWLKIECPLE